MTDSPNGQKRVNENVALQGGSADDRVYPGSSVSTDIASAEAETGASPAKPRGKKAALAIGACSLVLVLVSAGFLLFGNTSDQNAGGAGSGSRAETAASADGGSNGSASTAAKNSDDATASSGDSAGKEKKDSVSASDSQGDAGETTEKAAGENGSARTANGDVGSSAPDAAEEDGSAGSNGSASEKKVGSSSKAGEKASSSASGSKSASRASEASKASGSSAASKNASASGSGGSKNAESSSGKQGASAEKGDAEISVRVTVDSSAVGGSVSAKASAKLKRGATAYDALVATGLSVQATESAYGVYVQGIGGLAEKEHGGESGWKYKVNGSFPSVACSSYVLGSGDTVEWVYVTKL